MKLLFCRPNLRKKKHFQHLYDGFFINKGESENFNVILSFGHFFCLKSLERWAGLHSYSHNLAPDAGGQPHLIGLAVGRNSAQRALACLQCSKPRFLHKKDGRKSRLYFLGLDRGLAFALPDRLL
ncbi:MAG: hypothetical protein JNJ93_00575 [Acinetobacter sp.]|nr:hypothetical protein [Acinetobacter sp.]